MSYLWDGGKLSSSKINYGSQLKENKNDNENRNGNENENKTKAECNR